MYNLRVLDSVLRLHEHVHPEVRPGCRGVSRSRRRGDGIWALSDFNRTMHVLVKLSTSNVVQEPCRAIYTSRGFSQPHPLARIDGAQVKSQSHHNLELELSPTLSSKMHDLRGFTLGDDRDGLNFRRSLSELDNFDLPSTPLLLRAV